MSVRVRFAPSPTGHLHIGSARTALFNWLLARHEKGSFVLRIEDTDRERSKDEYLEAILRDLRWLGLDWDEGPEKEGNYGPYFQSRRLDAYQEYANELLKKRKAYHCYCAPEELLRKREKAQAEKRSPGYDGTCRHLTEQRKKIVQESKTKSVIRFRCPENEKLTVKDAIRGTVDFSTELLEDFVIMKSDGFPVYNFACVVDDHLMEITHVLRGEEHLSNTPRQLLLYQAFGWEPPVFGHLSIILDEQRKKLSKREGATYLGEFRSAGFLPEALLNFLSLLGWAPKEDLELLPIDEIIKRFGFEGIGKSPAIFDFRKLEWMNSQYLRKLSAEDLAEKLTPFLQSAGCVGAGALSPLNKEKLLKLIPLFLERIKTMGEFPVQASYFFTDGPQIDPQAKAKLLVPETLRLLLELGTKLENTRFEASELETVVRGFAESRKLKVAELIQPLRLLLTGRTATPGIFDIMTIMGKEKTLERLRKGVMPLQPQT